MNSEAARKIIHVDMDAFYASVEIRDNPALKDLPVVVGGRPDSRGVVAAASYEARQYGIHSAMPCSRAARLCPRAIFLPPDFSKYQKASRQIRAIFYRYTDLVEPLSLDEAYLDVTRNHQGSPSATWIAQSIRQAILAETGLTASAGVAPNKFLAKIASDENKPNGLCVINPAQVADFVWQLPVEKVPGVGKVTGQALRELGFVTCGDLAKMPLAGLVHHFGKRGGFFHDIAHGIDHRPVESSQERKSVSIEDTFAQDHDEPEWLNAKLAELAKGLALRMGRAGLSGKTLTLKLRLADFSSFTRSTTPGGSISTEQEIQALAARLFEQSDFQGKKLRLLGLSVSQLLAEGADSLPSRQLEFPWARETELMEA